MEQVFVHTLEDARNEATVVSYTWDTALDAYTEEELGALLYDTLFELAPNLRPVYKKPRQVHTHVLYESEQTYAYIYICMCVCVCLYIRSPDRYIHICYLNQSRHICLYIYIYLDNKVVMCMWLLRFTCPHYTCMHVPNRRHTQKGNKQQTLQHKKAAWLASSILFAHNHTHTHT
jgi:hypothetical protein